MSVRSELEELVKWISELSAAHTEPAPTPLSRQNWQRIHADLDKAGKAFATARDGLVDKPGGRVLAELARDLDREAEGLALRAYVLSRRATPKIEHKHDDATAPLETPRGHDDEPPVHGQGVGQEGSVVPDNTVPSGAGGKHRDRGAVDSRPPTKLVASAQAAVEAAHREVTITGHADDAAKAFAGELEALAEMALSLQLQCKVLDEELHTISEHGGGNG